MGWMDGGGGSHGGIQTSETQCVEYRPDQSHSHGVQSHICGFI